MRPHPLFRDQAIPTHHTLGEIVLRALTVDDLDRDFNAVMASAVEIRAANPGSTWPEGLTKEKNFLDLAWHQREFESRRSFAWVMEGEDGEYLGCLYVYPSLTGEKSADVRWWWRTGSPASRTGFRQCLTVWLASADWPPLRYDLQPE